MVVGDECHIAARSSGGPRFDPDLSPEELDDYANLILLCRTHHKLIDDRPLEFSAPVVRKLKARHESKIREALQGAAEAHTKLDRIVSGQALFAIMNGSLARDFSHDDPENDAEKTLIADFLQNLADWGEIASDLEPSQQVDAAYSLHEYLKELNENGLAVFAVTSRRRMRVGKETQIWPVAMVRVVRGP